MFGNFECLPAQKPTNQDSQDLHFSRPYGRLLENPKTWASRELFLSENYFKTCSTVNFRKSLKKGILWFFETLAGVLLEERILNISK